MTLCTPIESSAYFKEDNGYAQSPNNPSTYYNFMNAMWGNSGVPFTYGGTGYGGTVSTKFLYDDLNNWSEISELNNPGDTKMILTNFPSFNEMLRPGQIGNINLAFIFARDSSNIASVEALFNVADSVQNFFNQTHSNACQEGFATVEDVQKLKELDISLYPNPAQSEFSIIANGVFSIEIYDLSGKLIAKQNNINVTDRIQAPLVNGIYMVRVLQNEQATTVLKLIKE